MQGLSMRERAHGDVISEPIAGKGARGWTIPGTWRAWLAAPNVRLMLLALAALALVIAFMTIANHGAWDFILPRRGRKVLAMGLTGFSIAYATVLFQTVSNNRILTPSIIGFDSLFVLIQTVIVFALGAERSVRMDENLNFLVSVLLMVIFAGALYRWLFQREGRNLYLLILVGVILGSFFGSISSFLQLVIDPNSFDVLMDRLFASFNTVNEGLLAVSVLLVAGAVGYSLRYTKYLDVLALGREQAINLGVDHARVVNRLMVVITILIAVPTALIGSITFLGLLVANLAYLYMGTYRHRYLIPAAALISIIALVGGQLIIERVFTFSTTLAVIVNFTGGILFVWLLLRESNT